jgi:hypothetical protein
LKASPDRVAFWSLFTGGNARFNSGGQGFSGGAVRFLGLSSKNEMPFELAGQGNAN